MHKSSFFIRLFAALALPGIVMAVYKLWARPAALHWGATDAEIRRPMPGDELDPTPTFYATRAITIDAPPAAIWPWLVQMGFNRAGFYGYDIMESIGSTTGPRSADRILPELQNFKVDDKVPISLAAEEVFYAIQPDQYLIWAGETGKYPGGFIWALYPLDETHTRLVSRIRWTHHSIAQTGPFALDLLTEFTDHLAVRKILQGIKDRVEGHIEPAYIADREFIVYVLAALIFLAAFLLVLVLRPLRTERWLAALAAGAGWLITWYTPLPYWGGAILEATILVGLLLAFFKIPIRRHFVPAQMLSKENVS